VAAGRFDHARTRLPLDGKHGQVACDRCHVPGQPMSAAPVECAGCHDDAHRGQLGRDCAACHTADGFRPARFGLEEHEAARMPLEGAHRAVACDACHRVEQGVRRFRFATLSCAGCHADPHRGETVGVAAGCASCHRVASWSAVEFEHAATRFRLDGAHRQAACGDCHARGGPLAFAGTVSACAACHADEHDGQLTGSCERCQATESFEETHFDHQRMSRFALAGAHREVACERCHPREEEGGRRRVRYRPREVSCAGCHG
jgi:hypothetical protein